MTTRFDAFVGVDWSGAVRAAGIAIAVCDRGGDVDIVSPETRWTRTAAISWVLDAPRRRGRVLVGFDFAFGLPCPTAGYLRGFRPDLVDLPQLWAAIHAAGGDDDDLYGGAFAIDKKHAGAFWPAGTRRPAWWRDGVETQRATELTAIGLGHARPASVLNHAAASKQVGMGSLAGMRALHRLRGAKAAIWPLDRIGRARLVAIEIFPTLYRVAAGHGSAKIRTVAALKKALGAIDARLADEPATIDDHVADADVSAAGLRRLVDGAPPRCVRRHWRPTGLTRRVARTEGWIFGVTP